MKKNIYVMPHIVFSAIETKDVITLSVTDKSFGGEVDLEDLF